MNASRHVIRLSVLAFVVVFSACTTLSEPTPPELADTESALSLAVAYAFQVDDPLVRAELYLALADAYLSAGNVDDMSALARDSLGLAELAGASEGGIRMRLHAAGLLVQSQNPEAGLKAIETATDLVIGVQSPRARADLLVDVVRAGLLAGEIGRPAFRTAIDETLILDDPGLRAETIIRIADLYQSSGAGLSVAPLIQQAIPAIRSLPTFERRILLFSRLAVYATDARETPLALRLIDIVDDELDQATGSDIQDGERIMEVIQVLTRLGATQAAQQASELLEDPLDHARALTILARTGETAEQRTDLLGNALALIDGLPATDTLVEVLVAIGEGYLSLGMPESSEETCDTAFSVVASLPVLSTRIDLISAIAELYAGLGKFAVIQGYLDSTTDTFVRGTVSIAVADRLRQDDQLQMADEYLDLAQGAADQTEFLPDALRLEIVLGYVATGNLGMAVQTMLSMKDVVTRARAMTTLALGTRETRPLRVEELKLLESVL